jgi:hypothetical protein
MILFGGVRRNDFILINSYEENMSEATAWEFMLNGDTREFRQYAREQRTDYFNIYGGVNDWLDCENDDFRMTSVYCDGETDSTAVWQLGYELISIFNGASILFSKNYRKASISKLLNNNIEVSYVKKMGIYALLGKPSINSHKMIEGFHNYIIYNRQFTLLHLATENEDVYFILKYLDMNPDWSSYYKLMEAIETFAKKSCINLETNQSERKSFTNTANNFSLSGFDSRHGFKELAKRNNTESMTLDQAYTFVTTMAKIYLQKRYFPKDKMHYKSFE